MSGNNRPNLAGWAAILTAMAAIITAIGFTDFFPDLVKQKEFLAIFLPSC